MSENQKDPQYKLRWSESLRDKVQESAKLNNRSINAEIIYRLEQSFIDTTPPEDANILLAQIRELIKAHEPH